MGSSENKAPKNLNQNVTLLGKKKNIFLNHRPREFLEVICMLFYPPFQKKKKEFVFAVHLFIMSHSHLTEVQLTLLYI